MTSHRLQRTCQRLILFGGLVLAGYLMLVYRPLKERAGALDVTLTNAWSQLLATGPGARVADVSQLDLVGAQLRQVEKLGGLLRRAGESITGRIRLDSQLDAKVREPFQLVEFQNERQRRIEDFAAQAKPLQVALAPGALAGFPSHSADRSNPELLWVQLAVANKLCAAALACKVSSIQSLSVLPVEAFPSTNNAPRVELFATPVRFEVVGSMEAIARLVASLPARGPELKVQGLPEIIPAQPTLFLDHILLRRQTPEKPDDVQLELVVCTFVQREIPSAAVPAPGPPRVGSRPAP